MIINDVTNLFFSTAISILVISNRNSSECCLIKLLSYRPYSIWKICLHFNIENGQPREPALGQLYRHTFVPSYRTYIWFLGTNRAAFHSASQLVQSFFVGLTIKIRRKNPKTVHRKHGKLKHIGEGCSQSAWNCHWRCYVHIFAKIHYDHLYSFVKRLAYKPAAPNFSDSQFLQEFQSRSRCVVLT